MERSTKKKKIKNGGRGKEEGAALFADGQTGEANMWRDGCKYADKEREKNQDVFLQKSGIFRANKPPKSGYFFHVSRARRLMSARF